MSELVDAVNHNGVKQRIPTDWLTHPVLGPQFRLPPSATTAGIPGQHVATSGTTTEADPGHRSADVDDAGAEKE